MIRYKVKVNLGIFSQTEGENSIDYKILVINNNEPPGMFLYDKQTVQQKLDKIFSQFVHAHSESVEKIFCGNENDGEILEINYICMIPNQVKNKNGVWVSVFELMAKESEINNTYKKMLDNVSNCYTR